MNRRRFLAAISTAGTAGCLGGPAFDSASTPTPEPVDASGPTQTPAPTDTPTPDPDGDEEQPKYQSLFVDRVESDGVTVDGIEVGSNRATVDAYLVGGSMSAARELVATVSRAYSDVVDRGWPVSLLDANALNSDDQTAATFSVKRIWARRYASGGLDENDYLDRVTGTMSVDRTLLSETTPVSGEDPGSEVTPMLSMGYHEDERDGVPEIEVAFTYRAQRAIDPTADDGENWTPGEGEKWLVLRVEVTNMEPEPDDDETPTDDDFAVFDPGVLYVIVVDDSYHYSDLDGHENPLTGVELAPEESVEGYVYFDIPDEGDTASLRIDQSDRDEKLSITFDIVNDYDEFPVEMPVYAG